MDRETIADAVREILDLVNANREAQAIERYEAMMAKLKTTKHTEDPDLLTLVLDAEFLVYGHPGSSSEEVERDLIALRCHF